MTRRGRARRASLAGALLLLPGLLPGLLLGCVGDGLEVAVRLRLPAELVAVRAEVRQLSLQPVDRELSVDWARYPEADGWWDSGLPRTPLVWTRGSPETCVIGAIAPPTGRWHRAWLDVEAGWQAKLPAGTTATEDHVEPIAVPIAWPDDSGGALELELVALPSATAPGAWALFAADARVVR